MKNLFNYQIPNSCFLDLAKGIQPIVSCTISCISKGDSVRFVEVDSQGKQTGHYFYAIVLYVLPTNELRPNSCVFSFERRTDTPCYLPSMNMKYS